MVPFKFHVLFYTGVVFHNPKNATNRTECRSDAQRSDAQRAGANFLLTLAGVRFVEDTLFLLDRSMCQHIRQGRWQTDFLKSSSFRVWDVISTEVYCSYLSSMQIETPVCGQSEARWEFPAGRGDRACTALPFPGREWSASVFPADGRGTSSLFSRGCYLRLNDLSASKTNSKKCAHPWKQIILNSQLASRFIIC